jgi:isopenicillin-N N-acyltransferase-like protein
MPHSLYFIDLAGDSRHRGIQYGRELRVPIERARNFYLGFFEHQLGISPVAARARADGFAAPTAALSSALMAELEGIAEGARLPLTDVLLLSARYEITFAEVALGECSNVFVGGDVAATGSPLLGQNWDWRPEVLDFRVVIRARCDDLPDHLMISECGQPGKYGISSSGLGIVEAGLNCTSKEALGEHLFTALGRAALEQPTYQAAVDLLVANQPRATVQVLVAAASGAATSIEYTPQGLTRENLGPADVRWHTNHCRLAREPSDFQNSIQRGHRWAELLEAHTGEVGIDDIQSWLADRTVTPEGAPICQLVDVSQADAPTRIQTLASLVLAPAAGTIWVTDGPSSAASFQSLSF